MKRILLYSTINSDTEYYNLNYDAYEQENAEFEVKEIVGYDAKSLRLNIGKQKTLEVSTSKSPEPTSSATSSSTISTTGAPKKIVTQKRVKKIQMILPIEARILESDAVWFNKRKGQLFNELVDLLDKKIDDILAHIITKKKKKEGQSSRKRQKTVQNPVVAGTHIQLHYKLTTNLKHKQQIISLSNVDFQTRFGEDIKSEADIEDYWISHNTLIVYVTPLGTDYIDQKSIEENVL